MSIKVSSAASALSFVSSIRSKEPVKNIPQIKTNYSDTFTLSIPDRSFAISQEESNPAFSLSLYSEKKQKLDVNYFYSEITKDYEMNISYQFEKSVNSETGKYQFNLKIKGNTTASYSQNKSFEKEDILKFIQRVVDEVMTICRDDKKLLKGIVLSGDDLAELRNLGDKKTGRLIQTLLSMLLLKIQMENMNDDKKDAKKIILKPERHEYEVTEKTSKLSQSIEYSAELKRIE